MCPAKQCDAQTRLQRFNLLAQRRLRHVQTLRGAVHMELFGYHQKITHQTKLHDEVRTSSCNFV